MKRFVTLLVRRQGPDAETTIEAMQSDHARPLFEKVAQLRRDEAVTGLWLIGESGYLLHSWRAQNPAGGRTGRKDTE